MPFRYYDPPGVASLSPSSGPAQGGTRVVLTGANFSALGSQLVCRWGGTYPNSLPWVLLEELTTPPQRDLPFAHSPAAQSALPFGLRGPNGVAARPAYNLAASEVFATVTGPQEAVCLTPARLGLRAIELALELSLNGHDFTADRVLYQYYAASPLLLTTWPLTDTSGGHRPVTVRGMHLANGSHYQCLYERSGEVALVTVDGTSRDVDYPYNAPPSLDDAEAPDARYSQLLEGRFPDPHDPLVDQGVAWPDGTTVECPSPSLDVWARVSPLRLTLRVTLNGQQFTPPLLFVITGPPPLVRHTGLEPRTSKTPASSAHSRVRALPRAAARRPPRERPERGRCPRPAQRSTARRRLGLPLPLRRQLRARELRAVQWRHPLLHAAAPLGHLQPEL